MDMQKKKEEFFEKFKTVKVISTNGLGEPVNNYIGLENIANLKLDSIWSHIAQLLAEKDKEIEENFIFVLPRKPFVKLLEAVKELNRAVEEKKRTKTPNSPITNN